MISISVIIPTYERIYFLDKCLRSVSSQTGNICFEIIVCLDKKDCGTEKWLKLNIGASKKIQYVRALRPGVNAARNVGIDNAKGGLLCFIDDDCCLPSTDWLKRIRDLFLRNNDVAGIGGPYLLTDQTDVLAETRNFLDNFFIKQNLFDLNRSRALLGGNATYKKNVLRAYGGFDENIIYGAAETELNNRLIYAGEKLLFFEDMGIIHLNKKQGSFSYLKKSFFQGLGQAYCDQKNINKECVQKKTIWFWRIYCAQECRVLKKIIIAIFLIQLAIAYHAGLIAASIYYKAKRRGC